MGHFERRVLSVAFAAALSLAWVGEAGAQQQLAQLDRGPRFMEPSRGSGTPREVDVTRVSVLRRRVSLNREGATVAQLLHEIARQTGLLFAYNADVFPVDRVVGLRADSITVAAALTEILVDAGVDVLLKSPRQAVLMRRRAPVQTGTIAGRVTDAGTGEPIVGADVRIAATRFAASANDSGQYVLRDVPAGEQRVTARRIGYQAVTLPVTVPDGGTVTLDFALVVLPTRLDEVVTTVTGDQRRAEIGNVIGRIEADSVAINAPVLSFADLLNARVPGVQVLPSNGIAGQATRIRVRGLSSATVTNDPIVIVDGIRFEQTPRPAGQFPPSTSFGTPNGRLADLNPEEIESVEIVKGPSAATLYGTDAANGVIIIKTKRGQPGRTQWNVYAEQNISSSQAEWPSNYYAWGRLTDTGAQTQCVLTQLAAGNCVQDSVTAVNPLTDPATSPFGTGYRQQVGLQVSGGSEALRYFVAGEYDHDIGVLRSPDAEIARIMEKRGVGELPYAQIRPNQVNKGSLRANLSARLSDAADVTLSTGFVRNGTRIPDANHVVAPGWFGRGYQGAPDYFSTSFGGAPGDAFSKMALEAADRFTTSIAANWRLAPWLATRATVGGDFSSTFFDGLQLPGQGVSTLAINGGRLNQRTDVNLYTADVGATATFSLGSRVSSSTAVGGQYTRRGFGQTTINATGLVVGSETATGATTITPTEQNVVTIVAGTYLQQTFGVNDRFFVTGAVRADGASAFGSNFSTSWYPKASGTWVISEEPFFGRPGWLSSLRFRAAYGASGVQPGPTSALVIATPVTVAADGGTQAGATFTTLGNPDLKPERQTEFEAGFDLELFTGRVLVEATYYNRKSSDALIDRPLAPSVGFGFRQENIGSVRNEGLEAGLSVRVVDGERTGFDLAFNGSLNRNRLLELAPGVTNLVLLQAQSRAGYPLFSAWSRALVSYADANSDGIIGLDEVVLTEEEVFLGPTTPTRQLTAAGTLTLFGGALRVNTMFDYRGGHVFRGVADRNRCIFAPLNCRGINDPAASLEEQANAVASNVIGFTYQDPRKADFVRWRELSAQLNLPDRWAASLGARTVSLTVGARNLALFTGFPYVDPEIAGINGTDAPASFPVLPPVRTWIFRANLGY